MINCPHQNQHSHNDTTWSLQDLRGYLPLQSIETFHHSRTFQANLGINPLVATSAPLFTLMGKLSKTHGYDDLGKLQRELIHEVRAFECNAIAERYHPNAIIAARYALVVALDETILLTDWGQSQLWINYSLTKFFYNNNDSRDYFFTFLETLLSNEKTPVDLLEFCYLCINLAFLGLHRSNATEFKHIQHLSDKLYKSINRQKRQIQTTLPGQIKVAQKVRGAANTPSIWMLAIIGFVLSMSVYLGFNYLVSGSTQPLYAKLEKIVDDVYESYA